MSVQTLDQIRQQDDFIVRQPEGSLPIRRWSSVLASHSGRARFLAYLLMNEHKCYRETPKMKILPKGNIGLSLTNVPLLRDNKECCWICVSARSVDEVLRTYRISTFVGSWLRSSLLFFAPYSALISAIHAYIETVWSGQGFKNNIQFICELENTLYFCLLKVQCKNGRSILFIV